MTRYLVIAIITLFAWQLWETYSEHNNIQALYTDLNNNPNPPMGGNPQGDVTVMEFFDYKCGYCKIQEAEFYTLLRGDPYVRVVFMELPIFGEASTTAAKAALAVNRIDSKKYYAFHQALMEKTGSLDMTVLEKEAGKLGISAAILNSAMQDPKIEEELAHIKEEAHALGIYGTPGLVVDGKVIKGSMDLDPLRAAIAAARKKS